MVLRYVSLIVVLAVLAGCGGEPRRGAAGPRLYLAGDGQLWVVDVAHQRVRRLTESQLRHGDPPHRIIARGKRLVFGDAYGDFTYALPAVRPDRVWVVDLHPRFATARSVREVTTDGVTTVPAIRPPRLRSPLAAVDGGLLLEAGTGLDVWDPRSGRIVRHLAVDTGTLGPTSGHVVASCTDPQCHALKLTDSRTGAARAIRAPAGFTFEPWTAAFAPGGRLLGIPVRVVADGPRQLAIVDVATGRVAIVPRSSVSPGYTLIAWSASGRDVFLTGGGAYDTGRVLVGYRLGAPGAQPIDVRVGDFFDVAAI